MSDLVIVESPAKAKTIKKYLGPGYEVVASMGHIRDLPKSKFGVDVDHDFEPQYVDIKGKERVESVTLAQVDENRKPIPEHSLKYRYKKGSIYYDGLQKQLQ